MITIASRLQAVRERIQAATAAAGRPPDAVRLIAVSKTFPAEVVREACQAGQHAFGENYLQEATSKIEAVSDLPLEWHFIGPLQSNKTRPVAALFSWVHTVDRLKLAERLSAARPDALAPLQVCIQVNVSSEESKSGCRREEAFELADAVARLPRLRLRGLMTIPELTSDTALQRQRFAALRQLKDELVARGLELDTLSMGMSDDLEAAIAEGATMVRIGRAIFGPRRPR
ncbi:MAG: YggS family pyridoxal phosphate-dependent enzyme [Betaproteobacteria bacterium]|nr:MAG: YggS family pyridoxal phosphate-dependent enzyme [Betaproteobacteria bacterium]